MYNWLSLNCVGFFFKPQSTVVNPQNNSKNTDKPQICIFHPKVQGLLQKVCGPRPLDCPLPFSWTLMINYVLLLLVRKLPGNLMTNFCTTLLYQTYQWTKITSLHQTKKKRLNTAVHRGSRSGSWRSFFPASMFRFQDSLWLVGVKSSHIWKPKRTTWK